MQFVFGYGSLAADLAGGRLAVLRGYRRVWGVAMDNSVDLPGYKHYRLRSDGSRPEVFVAYLDLEPDEGGATHGLCVPVAAERLPAIDARERNYDRVDVTEGVEPAPGRVWAYIGTPGGRRRLDEARDAGHAVVSAGYLERTRAVFAQLGAPAREDFERTAALDGLPVWELERLPNPE